MGSFGAHSDGCSCRYGPDSPCQSIHACAVHQSKTNPAITHRARFLLRTGQANRSELMWQLTSINSGAKVNEAGLRTRWEDVCTVPHRTMLGWACRPCQQQCIIQPVVMGDAYAHPPIPPPPAHTVTHRYASTDTHTTSHACTDTDGDEAQSSLCSYQSKVFDQCDSKGTRPRGISQLLSHKSTSTTNQACLHLRAEDVWYLTSLIC